MPSSQVSPPPGRSKGPEGCAGADGSGGWEGFLEELLSNWHFYPAPPSSAGALLPPGLGPPQWGLSPKLQAQVRGPLCSPGA